MIQAYVEDYQNGYPTARWAYCENVSDILNMEHGEGNDEVLEWLSPEQIVLEKAIILVRIPPVTDSETKMWVQVYELGGDTRKCLVEAGDINQARKRSQKKYMIKGLPWWPRG